MQIQEVSYNEGKNNPNWKGGVSKVSSYCLECGKKLNYYKSKYCQKCNNLGKRNSQWKEKNVGYFSLHNWVRRHKPKPEFCEECQKEKPYDLANISGKYLRDINDFQWLCRKCHMEEDGRIFNLRIKKLKNKSKECELCGLVFNCYNKRRKYCDTCKKDRVNKYWTLPENYARKKSYMHERYIKLQQLKIK